MKNRLLFKGRACHVLDYLRAENQIIFQKTGDDFSFLKERIKPL